MVCFRLIYPLYLIACIDWMWMNGMECCPEFLHILQAILFWCYMIFCKIFFCFEFLNIPLIYRNRGEAKEYGENRQITQKLIFMCVHGRYLPTQLLSICVHYASFPTFTLFSNALSFSWFFTRIRGFLFFLKTDFVTSKLAGSYWHPTKAILLK